MEFWKYYRVLKRRVGLLSGVAVIVFTVVAIARSIQGGGVSYTAVLRIFTTPPAGIVSTYVEGASMNNLGTLLTLASSQPVLQNVIRKLDLKMTVPELEGHVGIGQEGGTGILRITVTASDAREAKVIAQTVGEEFLAYIDELNKQETKTARTFLEDRLDQARKELLEAKGRLYAYQAGPLPVAVAASGDSGNVNLSIAPSASPAAVERTSPIPPGIVKLGDEGAVKLTKAVATKISEAMQRKRYLEQVMQSNKAQLAALQTELARTQPETVISVTERESPGVENLRLERERLRTELTLLQVSRTEEHPDVRRTQRQFDQVDRKLKEEMAKEGKVESEKVKGPNPAYQNLRQQIATLLATQQAMAAEMIAQDRMLKQFTAFLGRAPLEEVKLNELVLESTVREANYLRLAQEVDAIRVQEKVQNKLGNLTLMGPPLVYGGPLVSVMKNLVLALMMALGAGIGTVVALDYLDNRVKTPQDVETLLQLPILGIIPASESYPASWRRSQHRGWPERLLGMRERVARMLPGGRDRNQ